VDERGERDPIKHQLTKKNPCFPGQPVGISEVFLYLKEPTKASTESTKFLYPLTSLEMQGKKFPEMTIFFDFCFDVPYLQVSTSGQSQVFFAILPAFTRSRQSVQTSAIVW
jgi:hypothetical protein